MKKILIAFFVFSFSIVPATCEQFKDIKTQSERTVDPPPPVEEEEEPDPNS